MNRMLAKLVFAPALLIATGATLLSGIGTAFAQDNTPPVISHRDLRASGSGSALIGGKRYLNAGDRITASVSSSEPLAAASLSGAAQFLLGSRATPAQDLSVDRGPNNYSAQYIVQNGDNATSVMFRVSGVTDAAGNEASPTTIPVSGSVAAVRYRQLIIDTRGPSVRTFLGISDGAIGTQQMHPITFSEQVTGFDTTDITAVGATVNSITGSNKNFAITFTPLAAAVSLTLTENSVNDLAGNKGPDTSSTTQGIALGVGISDLDDESGVSLNDAKFFYYAHTLGSELDSSSDARTGVLGPLTTNTEDTQLMKLLTGAKGNLSGDLNGDEITDYKDAAVLYYSFALEGSLGNGGSKPGIDAIKKAILGPFITNPNSTRAINAMLQRVYQLRGE